MKDLHSHPGLVLEAVKLGTEEIPVHKLFSFEELKEATNNFHGSTLIGEGSTGKIYKGKLENGIDIAIRHLTVSKKYTIRNLKLSFEAFCNVLLVLSNSIQRKTDY
ncbi:hypothetical protein L1887_30023 [Cichorium endivia]|nr:hypothetical protein L1887_30023 [Cichorium endivia]